LPQRLAERLGERLAFVIEGALCRDIIEIERVGVGLIRECRAVPHQDDMPAGPQGRLERFVVRGRLRGRTAGIMAVRPHARTAATILRL